MGAGGQKDVTGGSVLPANAWSHLAATYDGSTLSLYVNGFLVNTRTLGSLITTSTGVLRIGGNSIYGEFFNGLIDEVRIYSRALNQGEILADMSTPIGGTPETTAPTVSLTMSSGLVAGITTLSATAADNVVVAGVQFLVDGVPVGAEDTTAPYSFAWNTALLPNGNYSISARARDAAGNTTTSTPVLLKIANELDQEAPEVNLTGITPNATVGGTVILSATSGDNLAVAGVQFQVNGTNIGSEVTAAPYRIVWDTTALVSGTYSITAIARDSAGNLTTSTPVTVNVDSIAPTVTATTPSANATAIVTSVKPTVTFSEDIQSGTLSFVLKDAGNNPLAATVQYNAVTRTATLVPAASLSISATYTLTVSGVKDVVGNTIANPVTWSFSTANSIVGATIWDDSVTPAITSANDSDPVELGVKFRSDTAGYITGIRFYKGIGNTGTHVGKLWSSTGALLASATFVNESGTGWQTVTFSNPVPIAANTTYIASYYAPNGHYAVDSQYFASGANSFPLRALASGEDGANGLFKYATGGGFPNDSYQSGNYWVDVVFGTSTNDTAAPTVVSQTPAAGTIAIPVGSVVTVSFSEPIQANTLSFVLKDAANNTVNATVSYDDVTRTATLTPSAALATNTTYTATISGALDAAGNPMASAITWSFTTVVQSSSASSSIWDNSVVPATTSANDNGPIELGLKFRSDTAGYITGVRFYKGIGNTGTHVGKLWSSTGTLLATATFVNETATGWQVVSFSTPVAIAANTTYIVSYYAPNGHYAFNSAYLATGLTNGNLRAGQWRGRC